MQTRRKGPGLGTRVRLLPPAEPCSQLMLGPWPHRRYLATLGCVGNPLATGHQGQSPTPPPNALLHVFLSHPAPPRLGARGSHDLCPQSWPNCIGTPGLPGPGPSFCVMRVQTVLPRGHGAHYPPGCPQEGPPGLCGTPTKVLASQSLHLLLVAQTHSVPSPAPHRRSRVWGTWSQRDRGRGIWSRHREGKKEVGKWGEAQGHTPPPAGRVQPPAAVGGASRTESRAWAGPPAAVGGASQTEARSPGVGASACSASVSWLSFRLPITHTTLRGPRLARRPSLKAPVREMSPERACSRPCAVIGSEGENDPQNSPAGAHIWFLCIFRGKNIDGRSGGSADGRREPNGRVLRKTRKGKELERRFSRGGEKEHARTRTRTRTRLPRTAAGK